MTGRTKLVLAGVVVAGVVVAPWMDAHRDEQRQAQWLQFVFDVLENDEYRALWSSMPDNTEWDSPSMVKWRKWHRRMERESNEQARGLAEPLAAAARAMCEQLVQISGETGTNAALFSALWMMEAQREAMREKGEESMRHLRRQAYKHAETPLDEASRQVEKARYQHAVLLSQAGLDNYDDERSDLLIEDGWKPLWSWRWPTYFEIEDDMTGVAKCAVIRLRPADAPEPETIGG